MNDQPAEKQSWWQRLSGGLKRTSVSIGGAVSDLVVKRRLDQAMLDEIEDVLIRADLGIESAARIATAVGEGRYDKAITADEVKAVVAAEVEKVLTPVAKPLAIDGAKPFVALVVGVNGSGKTTTIGKLAARFRAEGRSVMLAAGDTFRAAAIDQLNIWGGRSGASIIARAPGADAAGRDGRTKRALPSRGFSRYRRGHWACHDQARRHRARRHLGRRRCKIRLARPFRRRGGRHRRSGVLLGQGLRASDCGDRLKAVCRAPDCNSHGNCAAAALHEPP